MSAERREAERQGRIEKAEGMAEAQEEGETSPVYVKNPSITLDSIDTNNLKGICKSGKKEGGGVAIFDLPGVFRLARAPLATTSTPRATPPDRIVSHSRWRYSRYLTLY